MPAKAAVGTIEASDLVLVIDPPGGGRLT
jgi:hypothetical protein